MKKIFFFLATLFILTSCEKAYKVISNQDFMKLAILDTLVKKPNLLVLKVGDSISDVYPRLLVKSNRLYHFDSECEIQNDSTILSYYPPFIYDYEGEIRKNGIWAYTSFYTKGKFPFETKGMNFSVDSIPKNWNQKVPTQEGIYFFENNSLNLFSNEQSEEKFKEKEKNGFYFFPNKGRLFDKININKLD
jgi:hypothetical protein